MPSLKKLTYMNEVGFETVWLEKGKIKMKKNDEFGPKMGEIAKLFKITDQNMQLLFDGRRVQGTDTPDKIQYNPQRFIVVCVERGAPVDVSSIVNDKVEQLAGLGFDKALCERALRENGMDIEKASNWLLEQPEPAPPVQAKPAQDPAKRKRVLEMGTKKGMPQKEVEELIDTVCCGNLDEAEKLIETL